MTTTSLASTSTDTVTQLCGVKSTLNARVAFLGNLFSQSIRDLEVFIYFFGGVLMEILGP